MKLKAWFLLSLGLNATLLLMLAGRGVIKPQERRKPDGTATRASVEGNSQRNTLPSARFESLREAGIPNRLIAAVAAADYEQQWQKRLLVLQKEFARGDIDEATLEEFVAEHDAGLEDRMLDSLGEAGFREWDLDRVLCGFDLESLRLSGAETDRLYQLQKEHKQHCRDLQAALRRGEIDEAVLERQTEASHSAHEQQLKELLGEARYASLQPGDSAAGELRRDLARIEASDAQVDAMLTTQQQWQEARERIDAEWRDEKSSGPEHEQQLEALDTSRDEIYLQTLGPDVFAELQKHQDDRYRTMQRHARAWHLSDDDITYIYDSLQARESNARDHTRRASESETKGEAVDWDAVQSSLRDFERQTNAALQKHLGIERFEQLKRSGVMSASP